MEDEQADAGPGMLPVSRDQISGANADREILFFPVPCSPDHVQDWQPYPVDSYSCYLCAYTYIHTYPPKPCFGERGFEYPCHVYHENDVNFSNTEKMFYF